MRGFIGVRMVGHVVAQASRVFVHRRTKGRRQSVVTWPQEFADHVVQAELEQREPHLEYSISWDLQLVREVPADQKAGDGVDGPPDHLHPLGRIRDPRNQGRGPDERMGHDHGALAGCRLAGRPDGEPSQSIFFFGVEDVVGNAHEMSRIAPYGAEALPLFPRIDRAQGFRVLQRPRGETGERIAHVGGTDRCPVAIEIPFRGLAQQIPDLRMD